MRQGLRALAVAALAMAGAQDGLAQEFSLFLRCEGELAAADKPAPAHADFAFRFNNRTALIQRSNVLPVGERLDYVASPQAYSMTYRLPERGTRIVALPGWFYNTILVLHPDLERLNQIRISIDRQSGALDGEILNEAEQTLAKFAMQCQPVTDAVAPKF